MILFVHFLLLNILEILLNFYSKMTILIIGVLAAVVSGIWIWWASRELANQPNPLEGVTDPTQSVK